MFEGDECVLANEKDNIDEKEEEAQQHEGNKNSLAIFDVEEGAAKMLAKVNLGQPSQNPPLRRRQICCQRNP